MNWDDLKIALAVGRAGSLTKAADLLGIDQSTAGRRLTALEADLGETLFTRLKTGFAPTEAGEAAIARAGEIETRLDRLNEELSRAKTGPVGVVRLVGNTWILRRLTTMALPDLLAAHPRLDIRIVTQVPRVEVRGEATLSLWFENPPREGEFAIKLGEVPYAVYALTELGPDVTDWVAFYDEDAPRRAPMRAFERLRGKGDRLRLTATDADTLHVAVRAGIGKALLPMCLADEDPALTCLSKDTPALMRPLYLQAHPDTVGAARVQATIRWVRQTFETVFAPPDGG